MDDERLIEMVRRCPVLYDCTHSKYMDTSYKLGIWSNIAKELKEDMTSCKTRWNNIRDNYRKSLRKNAARSLQNNKRIKLYRYSDQLSFLKKIFEQGGGRNKHGIQDEDDETEDQIFEEEDRIEENTVTVKDEDVTSQFSYSGDKPTFDGDVVKGPIKNSACQKRKHHHQQSSREYIMRGTENQFIQSTSHAVDTFLAGIGSTLKSLNPYDLNLAKSEIFAIVQKYELNMLIDQQQYLSFGDNRATTSGIHIGDIIGSPAHETEEQ